MSRIIARLAPILTLLLLMSGSVSTYAIDQGDEPLTSKTQESDTRYFLPLLAQSAHLGSSDSVHIIALTPDGQASNDADEAFSLQNTGQNMLYLGGWQATDGEGHIVLPDMALAPNQRIWCAKEAVAFSSQWGFSPDCEYGTDSDPGVPNATGNAPRLANTGDELQLLNPGGKVIDAIVYAEGDGSVEGWNGPPVAYYQRNSRFAREGQVFFRLFNPDTLLPLTDEDTATDWAQGNPDPFRGRRAAYPGWDLYELSSQTEVTWETPPALELLVAPDNSYLTIRDFFAGAQHRIIMRNVRKTHPLQGWDIRTQRR